MDIAEGLVRDEFERSYSRLPTADEASDDEDIEKTTPPVRSNFAVAVHIQLTNHLSLF